MPYPGPFPRRPNSQAPQPLTRVTKVPEELPELGQVVRDIGYTILGVSLLGWQHLAVLRRAVQRNGLLEALGAEFGEPGKVLLDLFDKPDGPPS